MARPKKRPDAHESPTTSVSIRFPVALKAEAIGYAEGDRRSFNFYVVRSVEDAVERDRAKRKASR